MSTLCGISRSSCRPQARAKGNVVYRRTFVLDMDRYMAVLRDPGTPRFGSPDTPSPGTLVGVTRLTDPEFLIEIDLLAAVPA